MDGIKGLYRCIEFAMVVKRDILSIFSILEEMVVIELEHFEVVN